MADVSDSVHEAANRAFSGVAEWSHGGTAPVAWAMRCASPRNRQKLDRDNLLLFLLSVFVLGQGDELLLFLLSLAGRHGAVCVSG
jgi:hypothetical protein